MTKTRKPKHREDKRPKASKVFLDAQNPLPRVDIIEITSTNKDGELLAKPVKWKFKGSPPIIVFIPNSSKYKRKGRQHGETFTIGDQVLARLAPSHDNTYEARPIKRIKTDARRIMGVYEASNDGDRGHLRPVGKRYRNEVLISPKDAGAAVSGDLVLVDLLDMPKYGPQKARVVERLGPQNAGKNLSLIAIHTNGIPNIFSDDAIAQANHCKAAPLNTRDDLRNTPLVTIDGDDARDFDDAIWAAPDTDPSNPNGWHLLVAIADVAWYVRTGDPLDRNAFERGNSVYFPDKVVPMLPEIISNGWCSLRPNEDRPCLAVHMWINDEGKLLRHEFIRGLMRSQARLTYQQVQAAHDGNPDKVTEPLMESVITPIYKAFQALQKARKKRGSLDLNLVERKIVVDKKGNVKGVVRQPNYDSHKLIEEFMISANVAAAETLGLSAYPTVFRVHDTPDPDRINTLRKSLQTLDLKFPRAGPARPVDFNRLIAQVCGGPHEHMVYMLILRTKAQAIYSPNNIGHFGLSLQKYAHFTSPIRRYSDLLVHRALISSERLGEGGWNKKHDPDLHKITEFISKSERRASAAERETIDRFTAAFLSEQTGAIFRGRINGVARFGVFVTLDENGADGIIPTRNLPADFYDLDEAHHLLIGRRYRLKLRIGDVVDVRLLSTDDISGGIVFEYADQTDKIGETKIKKLPRKRVRTHQSFSARGAAPKRKARKYNKR